MDKTVSSKKFALDWSRLLGFDQANSSSADSPQLGRTGAKAGTKIAGENGLAEVQVAKLGAKAGTKIAGQNGLGELRVAKLGAKVGNKSGTKVTRRAN